MVFKNSNMTDLLSLARDKTLICFGSGRLLTYACESFADVSFFDRIGLIADNNKEKHVFCFGGREKPVHSIDTCLKLAEKEPLILITVADPLEIIAQLDNITELNNCNCFFYSFVQSFIEPYQLPANRAERESLKIPKIIHYCWFGGNPIPDDFKAYIETWEKHCPDYDIVRWDESNYDYKQNEYAYEAYRQKKWAFMSDFARLDIIYRHGGVYLDTDVELIRNIDDLLCDDAFCGFEIRNIVANGLGFGAVAGFPIIREFMNIYDEVLFENDEKLLVSANGPYYQTRTLCEMGLKKNNTLQVINGMKIYPTDVLAPMNCLTGQIAMTNNTYAIHHYSATWLSDSWHDKRALRYRKLADLFNSNLINKAI